MCVVEANYSGLALVKKKKIYQGFISLFNTTTELSRFETERTFILY